MFPVDRTDHRRVGVRQTYEVKQLWQLHHEIINMSLAGMKNVDIAEALNITPATVSNTLNSTLAKEKLDTLRATRDMDAVYYQQELADLSRKAMALYQEVLSTEESESPAPLHHKLNVANTVLLELAGLGAPKKVDIKTTHYSAADIEALKERGLNAARAAGILPPALEGEIVT